jgi:hypothetical protein
LAGNLDHTLAKTGYGAMVGGIKVLLIAYEEIGFISPGGREAGGRQGKEAWNGAGVQA